MNRLVAAAVLVAGLATLLAGCLVERGTLPPGSAPSGPPESFGPPVEVTPGPTGPVAIDPSLLAVLPRTVGGLPVTDSPEGDSDILADDVLPSIASAAVSAVAVDARAEDLVFVYVVRLLPNGFSDDVFRDWRDSYDAGACAGETEVVGRAEADVAGNHIFIGTCATGLRTYHTWIKDRGLLISISSTGDKRLGLVLLGNLPK